MRKTLVLLLLVGLLGFAATCGGDDDEAAPETSAPTEATDTSPESGAVRPEDTEKLLAVAPKYGIEIERPSS